jgi:hypothetical protein
MDGVESLKFERGHTLGRVGQHPGPAGVQPSGLPKPWWDYKSQQRAGEETGTSSMDLFGSWATPIEPQLRPSAIVLTTAIKLADTRACGGHHWQYAVMYMMRGAEHSKVAWEWRSEHLPPACCCHGLPACSLLLFISA